MPIPSHFFTTPSSLPPTNPNNRLDTYVPLLVLRAHHERQPIHDGHHHPVPRVRLLLLPVLVVVVVVLVAVPVVVVLLRVGRGSHQGLRAAKEPPHVVPDGVGGASRSVPLLYGGGGVEPAAAHARHLVHDDDDDDAGVARGVRSETKKTATEGASAEGREKGGRNWRRRRRGAVRKAEVLWVYVTEYRN